MTKDVINPCGLGCACSIWALSACCAGWASSGASASRREPGRRETGKAAQAQATTAGKIDQGEEIRTRDRVGGLRHRRWQARTKENRDK